METLVNKEKEKIKSPIIEFISKELNNNFRTTEGNEISRVNRITISDILVDAENSEFKKKIIVNGLNIIANVRVILTQHTSTDRNINILVNGLINITYNFEKDDYIITNLEELMILDRTF